ncbi:MAG: ABC transporter substrate-binding protein, partial [Deltaproteobacteria bacterium]|nr:ABC transporter substrate-binding protein [Deltaproteobacteria bacterium]
MKKTNLKPVLVSLAAVFLLASIILIPGLSAGKETPTGDVVYATYYNMFYTKGGDPATHYAGQGPLLATTVFEGLVDYGVDLSLLPSVAKSWKIAPDWSYVDFDLKEGVKFHNGETLTAEDVKSSMEICMNKRYRHILGQDYRRQIKDIQVIDTYKVRFNLNLPAPDLWKRLWWSGPMMPKKYREKVGNKGFADKPIGTGPFKWVEYEQDRFFKMEAVQNHHRKTPEIKTLKIVYVPEHSTRLAMLQAGEADIAELIGPHIPVIKSDANLKLLQVKYTIGSSLAFLDLAFPNEPSPFHDIRVRKAVSFAINRKAICEKILFGGASPHGEPLCPYNMGFDPTVKPDPYDPEKARALLAEAGYPNGFKTEINTTPGSKYYWEAIAANLADVGINCKMNLYEGGAWFGAHRGKKLRGLKDRNSWYDAEPHPGADLQNGYT